MKKIFPLIFTMIYPYLIVAAFLFVIKGEYLMAALFDNDIFSLLALLLFFYLTAFIITIIRFIRQLTSKNKETASNLLRINLIIKLVHIPAYIAIFLVGAGALITIFTAGISVLLFFIDVSIIFLSGLIGIPGILKAYEEKKILIGEGLVFSILQFIFCIDVISSGIVLLRVTQSDKIKEAFINKKSQKAVEKNENN